MIVSLPYAVGDFSQVLKDKFKASVATAADVKVFRVTINNIIETQPNSAPIHVDFSVRVPAQSLGKSLRSSQLCLNFVSPVKWASQLCPIFFVSLNSVSVRL